MKDARGVGEVSLVLAGRDFSGGLLPCGSLEEEGCAVGGEDDEDGDVSSFIQVRWEVVLDAFEGWC